MRIVHVANFYGPRSGGLRTAMHALGAGYRAAGHDPVLVVPGGRALDEETPYGRRITVPAPTVPGTGGYRLVTDVERVTRILTTLRPDRLEVSDRTTLRGLGTWARRHGVGSVMFSHELLTGLLDRYLPPLVPTHRLADALNLRTARSHDVVVCTTGFAESEFRRIGAANVARVPLGVDLQTFHPARHDPALRARLAGDADVLLVHCGRLSPEKRADRSVDALRVLVEQGVSARLVVAGSGPTMPALRRRARGLPVTFLGFLAGRSEVARLLASADVVLTPGPLETFGLAALEALASGTPAVVSARSALGEIVTAEAGAAVPDDPAAFAAGVRGLLDRDPAARRAAARCRAEQFPWHRTVSRMLDLHGAPAAHRMVA